MKKKVATGTPGKGYDGSLKGPELPSGSTEPTDKEFSGIMLDNVDFTLDEADMATANQLDLLRNAMTSRGSGTAAASRDNFAAARNVAGSNISDFSAFSDGMTFTLKEHVPSMPGKVLGGRYVMDLKGNISNTQGKNIAVSPYFNRIGINQKNKS